MPLRKNFCAALGLLGQVDLARFQAAEQLIGRHVNQNDFIRIVQHCVRHRLMHRHAGAGAPRAGLAFQVLNIER